MKFHKHEKMDDYKQTFIPQQSMPFTELYVLKMKKPQLASPAQSDCLLVRKKIWHKNP